MLARLVRYEGVRVTLRIHIRLVKLYILRRERMTRWRQLLFERDDFGERRKKTNVYQMYLVEGKSAISRYLTNTFRLTAAYDISYVTDSGKAATR